MITQYYTESGSIYEVDSENMKARASKPTTVTRATKEWKRILDFQVKDHLILIWHPEDVPPLSDQLPNTVRTMYTSKVVKVVAPEPEP